MSGLVAWARFIAKLNRSPTSGCTQETKKRMGRGAERRRGQENEEGRGGGGGEGRGGEEGRGGRERRDSDGGAFQNVEVNKTILSMPHGCEKAICLVVNMFLPYHLFRGGWNVSDVHALCLSEHGRVLLLLNDVHDSGRLESRL